MDMTRPFMCDRSTVLVNVHGCTINYKNRVEKCVNCSTGLMATALIEITENVNKLMWAKNRGGGKKTKRGKK